MLFRGDLTHFDTLRKKRANRQENIFHVRNIKLKIENWKWKIRDTECIFAMIYPFRPLAQRIQQTSGSAAPLYLSWRERAIGVFYIIPLCKRYAYTFSPKRRDLRCGIMYKLRITLSSDFLAILRILRLSCHCAQSELCTKYRPPSKSRKFSHAPTFLTHLRAFVTFGKRFARKSALSQCRSQSFAVGNTAQK